MNRGKRLAIVSAFLLMGLVFYAAFPLAAHADDTTPQPPPPTDTTTPVPDGSSGGGATGVDATAVAVQPIAPDLSGSSSTGQTGTTSTGSVAIPAGMGVVPVDSSGNPVPLATATAVSILSTGDPIWCPAGASPSAGANGCSPTQTNLSSLVSYLTLNQPNANGTIWITNGVDTSVGTVALNGTPLSTWSTHALTIQGGWDGTTGGSIVGETTLGANLNIANWSNDISLNDLIFNGSYLLVSTTGNIRLHQVEGRNSPSFGALLTNISGVGTSVTVSDGNFHNNATNGILIQSNTDATLSNVIASHNGTTGALISTANGSVSIGDSSFNSNADAGLIVAGNTNIDLSNVIADLNSSTVTHAGTVLVASEGDVSIDASEFSGNMFDGLNATASDGSVELTNVDANQNDFSGSNIAGAYLSAGDGHVLINGGSFNSNYYDGLEVQASGSITLNNVTADANDLFSPTGTGTLLNAGLNGNVSISNSAFSSNEGTGLVAQSLGSGSISLNGVTANSNDVSAGAHVGTVLTSGTTGNVSINASSFNDNSFVGLVANAGGSMSLDGVSANGNLNNGAVLIGNGNLDMNGASFSGNGLNGLIANVGGRINSSAVNADLNGQAGAILTSGNGIVIKPSSSFSNNQYEGLVATTGGSGSISLDGVTANANGQNGASGPGTVLTSGATGNISINGSSFDNNYRDALYAVAGGQLTLTGVSANGNQITAGSANASTFLSTSGSIAISNSTFNSNHFDGLHADALGGITVQGSQANLNAAGGHLTLASAVLNAQGPVSVTGSSFDNNKWNGLNIETLNTISLVDVTANSNQTGGPENAGAFLTAGGNITIDPSTFNQNTGRGLVAQSGGSITMEGVTLDNNGASGAVLSAASDIMNHCVGYVDNGGYGLEATLPGTLSLNGVGFVGNVSGDYTLSGGGNVALGGDLCQGKVKYKTPTPPPAYLLGATPAATPAAAAPQLNVLNVTDGQTVNLDCTTYSGTTLALSNRDQIILLCPVTGQATLKHVTVDALPSKLDTTMTYQSAMDAEVTQSGQTATTLNGPMKVDFVVPSGAQGTTNLSILHWDGKQWVDVGGTATPDGFIETITNQTGTFVLISR